MSEVYTERFVIATLADIEHALICIRRKVDLATVEADPLHEIVVTMSADDGRVLDVVLGPLGKESDDGK